MIGTTVSHYRIVEKLGSGGMGDVYRAEDTHLGRDVALKFLPPEMSLDPEASARFQREARAGSTLDHANICTIYDVDESDGRPFIVMAYYSGETLESKLGRETLSVEAALDIARQIALGLDRAHEGGIVHRDIKPANVIITEHGEVKILDFGVAKLLESSATQVTQAGTVVGTPSYMSPEQLESEGVGPASDLWSLGVVLYEMLTGKVPFSGPTPMSLVKALALQDPVSPAELREDVEGDVGALVLELLSKRPTDRPASAGDVADRLQTFLSPVAVEVVRRPPIWLIAAGVLLVAAVIFFPARNRARVDAARASLPEIEALAEQGRYAEAYVLAYEAERVLIDDTLLSDLLSDVSDVVSVETDPPGAEVWARTFEGGIAVEPDGRSMELGPEEAGLIQLGTTPLTDVRLPRGAHLLRFESEGYEPIDRVVSSDLLRNESRAFGNPIDIRVDVELAPEGEGPAGMVRVPAGAYTLVSADAPADATTTLGTFHIDRYEVTNADFAEFIRAGGYMDSAHWTEPIVVDGRSVPQGEARARFVDRTGLPAPRSWSEQQFEGRLATHPVTDITWYEAAAYCAWRGAALPTIYEWEKAARDGSFTHGEGKVMPWGHVPGGRPTDYRANFASSGTTPVDAHPLGLSPYGAYDMAGNVREFLANTAESGVLAMGGSWQDRVYQFVSISALDPMFAAPTLGFRCAQRSATPEAHGAGQLALTRRTPSYTPVDRATFESYLTHYRYDPVPPDVEILATDETEDWTRHRVAYNGVDEERILAYLYLPRNAAPPYQTMVFVASSGAFMNDRVSSELEWLLGANIRSGRAALGVVLDGMVERSFPAGTALPPSNSVGFRDLMVKHSTELSLSLDYLETRDDIDTDKLAYVGLSLGAGSRATLAAIDPRWAGVIFIGGGIDERLHPTVPEALNVNFIPYIDAPTLLLNGLHDEEHPWLTRAEPFWELLSEPKQLVLEPDEGHVPSPEVRVPAVNGFLDQTLGPIRP